MRTVFHNREISGLQDWYNPYPFPLVWILKGICGYAPSNSKYVFLTSHIGRYCKCCETI